MEDRLRYILGLVNDWLRFAEAKNGVLLTMCAVFIIPSATVLLEGTSLATTTKLYLAQLLLCLLVSAYHSGRSLIPSVVAQKATEPQDARKAPNPLFFADVCNQSADAYLQRLYESSGSNSREANHLEREYANQIVNISRITANKLDAFRMALWWLFAGLVTPPLAVTFLLFRR